MLRESTIRSQVARVRKICDRFPEVEVRSGQHHTFLVRGKKFAYYLDNHHGDGAGSEAGGSPEDAAKLPSMDQPDLLSSR